MADERVEIEVGGQPVSAANPLPTKAGTGSDIGGGKTLADLYDELVTLAGAKALSDIVTALGFSKGAGTADATTLRTISATDGPTVAVLGATNDAAVGDATGSINAHIRQVAKLLAAGLPAALGANGALEVEGVANGTPQPVSGTVTANLQPVTSGGSTPYRNLDLGVTGQVVKNGAGQLYGYYLFNNGSAVRFVKVYDKATTPTQSDTPVWTLALPAGAGANVAFPNGVAFASGISLRATTGVADADTGAPTANDVIVNLAYK